MKIKKIAHERLGIDITIEEIIKVSCYISIPLVLLIVSTILISCCISGNINSNINNVKSFSIMFLNFSLPMLIILGVLPTTVLILTEKCTFKQLGFIIRKKTTYLILIICFGIIFLCINSFGENNSGISTEMLVVHFMCVAISEEIMLRSVIYYNTGKIFTGKILNCIINGIIFAFIYHSNEDFVTNLMIRFPLGFLLAFVRFKQDDIYAPIGIHWMYNIFVSTL